MEQFVTTFNDFCCRDDVDVHDVRLHEEYDEPYDMFDEEEEAEDGEEKKTRPYIDIIHDVIAEIWYQPSDGPSTSHAHIFVSEDFKDELEFYEAINEFCSKADMIETVRAGSPYNRSLVAIYRGPARDDLTDRFAL